VRLSKRTRVLVIGVVLAAAAVPLFGAANRLTSTDRFCASCHIHPHATATWQLSTHYWARRGRGVHCVQCHLPPGGVPYALQKTRLGLRDAWGAVFKDRERIDWLAKSRPEYAVTHTFEASCLVCHANLYPATLTEEGEKAHLYYERNPEGLYCITCHLQVGHHDSTATRGLTVGSAREAAGEVFEEPAVVAGFTDFTERIPGTTVTFDMAAIPGGTFQMGSPLTEPLRSADEGAPREVQVEPFWMGRAEVSWNEFEAWYRATSVEGRTDTRALGPALPGGVDAVTGATAPYGNPDQGWGRGTRPAITMTHHAAQSYCRWLSEVTGRAYRLPTEAEWEYAARGGTETPYFFAADPRRLTRRGLTARIFGSKTLDRAGRYVVFARTSRQRTEPPSAVEPNPFGLVHMLGNVAEFCADRWAEGSEEYVVRGGSYRSSAAGVRCAARNRTRSDEWLRSDPQMPKSRWWYSDCDHVGFRVVCSSPFSDTLGSPPAEKEPDNE